MKIDDSDVQSEIEYWNSTICYVIGANSPSYVIEGFIRRIWRNIGVNKFVVLKKGMFIVQFCTMDKRDEILAVTNYFFDGKPLILKTWVPDMDVIKQSFDVLPTWVQLRWISYIGMKVA